MDGYAVIGRSELPDGSRRYEYGLVTKPLPDPLYESWEDFVEHTTTSGRRSWLAKKVNKANRPRLLGGRPQGRLRLNDAVALLEDARGACALCGRLAVEPLPRGPNREAIAWFALRHRIGTIDHRVPVVAGGSNHADNLRWCCAGCQNIHPSVVTTVRRAGLDDGHLFGLPAVPAGDRYCRLCQSIAEFRVYESRSGTWAPQRGVVCCPRCFKAGIQAPGGVIVPATGAALSTPDGWWGV